MPWFLMAFFVGVQFFEASAGPCSIENLEAQELFGGQGKWHPRGDTLLP
jgi:hypothetical protein